MWRWLAVLYIMLSGSLCAQVESTYQPIIWTRSADQYPWRLTWWGPIPDEWLVTGVDCRVFTGGDGNDRECIQSNQVCADCLLEAFDNVSGGGGLQWQLVPPIDIDAECVVCRQKYGSSNPPVFAPYFFTTYKEDLRFIKRQLRYAQKYPGLEPYWVETSPKAANINRILTERFKELFETTVLAELPYENRLRTDFPIDSSLWHIYTYPTEIAACCFRFSDLYQIALGINEFCYRNLRQHDCTPILRQLDLILDEAADLYLDMYQESLSRQVTAEIAEEVEFIWLLRRNDVSGSTPNVILPQTSLPSDQPDWFRALYQYELGLWCIDLQEYKAAVEHFSEAIRCNWEYGAAYIERAHAYLELGELQRAVDDYMTTIWQNLEPAPTPLRSVRGLLPDQPVEFAYGFLQGTMVGVRDAGEQLVPSLLQSLRGVSNGIWCFACEPLDVTVELLESVNAFIDYVESHTVEENLEVAVPEVSHLLMQWKVLSPSQRGYKTGYIFGKYGTDIILPGKALSSVRRLRNFKRATTISTLEQCTSTDAQIAIVRERCRIHQVNRQRLIQHAATEELHLPANGNVWPHFMQEKHAWDLVVPLTGDRQKDFITVCKFLKKHNITNPSNLMDTPIHRPLGSIAEHKALGFKKVINGHEVRAFFDEIGGELRLKNGYVKTAGIDGK
jgi:tetratricopeptide (TPR) repeat protein